MRLSPTVQALEPSATLAMATRAKELKAKGVKVCDFSVGEPDFTTPEHICEAARQAIAAGHTHYTQASGIPELKQAVVQAYARDYGIEFQPGQVVVSNGAKHAIHNALAALCGPGDEVIIPAPYWVSYIELVKLTGARPVIVPTDEAAGFKMRPEQLEAAITPATRMLMLCSPSNPTGSVYNRAELTALAEVCRRHAFAVLSDEIYDKLIYGPPLERGGGPGARGQGSRESRVASREKGESGEAYASFPTLGRDLLERTALVNGVSKSYAMTGWRIGWTITPAPVARAIGDLQSQETSNPCSISQYAAVAALNGPQQCVADMRGQFAKRRLYVIQRLREMPEVSFPEPSGAFYVFFNVSRHFGRRLAGQPVTNSVEFCTVALEQAHVALVAGSAFGTEGYVRLSFATDMNTLERGLDGIKKLLKG